MKFLNFYKKLFLIITTLMFLSSCGLYKKVDSSVPIQGEERARKNIEEGRGISLKNLRGNGSTNYEFSSSNPMWRATLELLDFLPLTTVDYSGGVIISDWYSEKNSFNESLKITIRFLSNEIATSNIKVIIHRKICTRTNECTVSEMNSPIKDELTRSILKKAAILDAESKNKKK